MTQSIFNKTIITTVLLFGSTVTTYKAIRTYHSVYDYEFYAHAPIPVMSNNELTVDLAKIKEADKEATVKARTKTATTCATGICLTLLLAQGIRTILKNRITKSNKIK